MLFLYLWVMRDITNMTIGYFLIFITGLAIIFIYEYFEKKRLFLKLRKDLRICKRCGAFHKYFPYFGTWIIEHEFDFKCKCKRYSDNKIN